MAPRAVWTGQLRLSLVSIPVEIYAATTAGPRVSFRQIHEPSGKRVRYEKTVKGVGPVEADEIVKGYQTEDGEYVLIDPEELKELQIETSRTLELLQFVGQDEIPPLYYDRPYYVVPQDDLSEDAYRVIRDALRSEKKAGLCQITLRGKEHLAAIRPCGDGLLLETLRYAEEVRAADPMFSQIEDSAADEEMLELAQQLIDKKTKPFDASAFHDSYHHAVLKLIEAKRKDEDAARAPAEDDGEPDGDNVVDLMSALKKSLKEDGGGSKAASKGKKGAGKAKKSGAGKSKGKKKGVVMADRWAEYRSKRDFRKTAEPEGSACGEGGEELWFSIQKHDASTLHYDLRLEWEGVLLSWAVPKGPAPVTGEKRLAQHTEDHPLDYGDFEGTIPQDEYGGGTVMLWDRGTWRPRGDVEEMLEDGNLKMDIFGERMRGGWALVRFPKGGEGAWLLVKEKDDYAGDDPGALTGGFDTSVKTGRGMAEIAEAAARPERKREAPGFRKPQLATLVDAAPEGDDWLHETKFDGYRLLAALGKDGVTLWTRNGKDWTEKLSALDGAFDLLPCDSALLDGEVMAAKIRGSAFSSLQRALGEGGDLVYFVFDALEIDGEDLTGQPQSERRARLEDLFAGIPEGGALRLSDQVAGRGPEIFAAACREGAEGIVSKKADAPYKGTRTRAWRKVKCTKRQEFVVGGYAPSDKDRPFASLLIGEYDGDDLRYRGRVGTGFSETDFDALSGGFRERKTSPFADVPRDVARDAVWVTPETVIEVEFTEFTADGHVRHGTYEGMREDKGAREVSLEEPDSAEDHEIAGVEISSPGREVFPSSGCTKLDVARHYERVGERMVEIAGHRPLSLVRAPKGLGGQTFFQKHAGKGFPDALREIDLEEADGTTATYIYATRTESFVAAAQIGTIEFHIWGSRTDRLERPDRLVFDLDPDEGLGWGDTRAAAIDLRDRLADLGLASGALVTGGKGVHVWVPLRRDHGWDLVKTFAKTVAHVMAEAEPDRFTATMSKTKRKGRIFLDWLRNERGATAIAPYSLRAREGAPVAVPVTWDELDGLEAANAFTMGAVKERLADPCPYLDLAGDHQRITEEVLATLERWRTDG